MTLDRERSVIATFAAIARNLSRGYDTVDLYGALTADCARLLDVASAGLLLADGRGQLHLMAASSQRTTDLETFQLQRDEGPCLDCYRRGVPVLIEDLRRQERRWPQFVPAATEAGFAAVHALPMRLQDTVLGTLGLFSTATGALDQDTLQLGQALADVASVALVADQVSTDPGSIAVQLQSALEARVVFEQAKGLLAEIGGLDLDAAGALLQRYARAHGQKLTAIAHQLVADELAPQQLFDHAAAAPKDSTG